MSLIQKNGYGQGWIKVHRSIKNHWVWSNAEYLKAWLTIILTVNHSPKNVLIKGQLIECSRGQSLNSLHTWVDILGRPWTVQKLRTFFGLLKKEQMINTEGLANTTRLTVCKYEVYQDQQHANNTQETPQSTGEQQTSNILSTTNKKDLKNEKNDIEQRKLSFASTLTAFKEVYTPELIAEFFDHWTEPNKSGKKMKFELQVTWDTSLRLKKWERNSYTFKRKPVPEAQPSSDIASELNKIGI